MSAINGDKANGSGFAMRYYNEIKDDSNLHHHNYLECSAVAL